MKVQRRMDHLGSLTYVMVVYPASDAKIPQGRLVAAIDVGSGGRVQRIEDGR